MELQSSSNESAGLRSPPRVSVVVPSYNRSALLGRCLSSLEAQTLAKQAYEVIVVDDGSVDDTPDVCAEFIRKATMGLVYVRGSHRGPAAARNLGISRARAGIVAFIDDDCTAARDWLEQISAPFHHEHLAGVEGKVVRHPDCTPFTHFVENLNGGQFLTANMAYRLEALEAVHGFDETYLHAAAEDWDLAFRVLDHGGTILFRPEAVVVHVPIPATGRQIMERARDRWSASILYRRHPQRWKATTGRTMSRSFAEGIFMGPFIEVRKWREYFASHPANMPRFVIWQLMASARLLVEYARLRYARLI